MARLFEIAEEALIAPQSARGDMFFRLGMMYASGRSGETDLVAAHQWFNLAAANGSEAARRYRAELSAEMTSAEIAEAQRRAREFMRLH